MATPRHRSSGWQVPVGRIAGIPLRIHVTFVLLVAFVVLANAQPGGLGVLGGLVWIAVIFGCVLLHELAHCVVARRLGANVRSIVLLPIGGVSHIESMPEGWSGELAVAAAGPLTSIGVALLAGAASLVSGSKLVPVDLYGGALLPRTAWLNLLLGGFNLLPAFPLDGGRVLRAVLERRRDVEVATRIAATVGRLLGTAMAVVGLFWNLWLILIGVFVVVGATAEERSMTIHRRLHGRPVRDLMRYPVATLDPRIPLSEVGPVGPWPQVVALGGRYIGLLDGSGLSGLDPRLTVGDVVDREAPTIGVDDDLGGPALDVIVASGYPALAVVRDAVVVGVIVRQDIEQWLALHA